MDNKLELMSPAGSLEGVLAAARGGADAVYFGGGDFNARRNAKNLTNEELEKAIKYLKLRGKHSYITVNTLLTDRELKDLLPFLSFLNEAGASAVIVQDLAVAKIIKKAFPDMPMHASTQLTVHNLAGAMAMKSLGFSRVVLSRELPLEEIKFISQNCGIETEIFVHGALCMSYSGQCYLSGAIGGRSGNRGLCAQPCRLNYSFFGESAEPHLSLKDLCLVKGLEDIKKAGVACVKIEGRMKRPEYTAYVTNVYRKAIDTGVPPSRQEMENLKVLFSRDGFTDGYFEDKKGPHMFGVRDEGDKAQLKNIYKEAQKLYNGEEQPTVGLSMEFSAKLGEKLRLSCKSESGQACEIYGPVAERANFRATSSDEIEVNLSKMGGTIFYGKEMEIDIENGLKIPLSVVNSMRREALETLASQRMSIKPRRELAPDKQERVRNTTGTAKYIFSFLKCEQITSEILDMKPAYVYIPLKEIHENAQFFEDIMAKGQRVAAVLDRIIFDRQWSEVLSMLRDAQKSGISAVVCTNVGQVTLLRTTGLEIRGDFGLNIFNSHALDAYRDMGLDTATMSFELNFAQIRDISKCIPTELIIYGRLPLMITENCIIKNRQGNKCTCQNGGNAIIDKTGRSFAIIAQEGCRSTLYNSDKLFLADKRELYGDIGLDFARLMFTTENSRECLQVAKSYIKGEDYEPERITRGLYIRGVE